MTDLNPEGLKKAAEEVADEMPSCAVCEDRDTRRCQYCRREAERYARAAVAAYLAHAHPVVTTVEELDALPVGTLVLFKQDHWERWDDGWYTIGDNGSAGRLGVSQDFPAHILHRGTP